MTGFCENESALQAYIEEQEAKRFTLLDNLSNTLSIYLKMFDGDMITFNELMCTTTKEIGEYIAGLMDFHLE